MELHVSDILVIQIVDIGMLICLQSGSIILLPEIIFSQMEADHPHPRGIVLEVDILLRRCHSRLIVLLKGTDQVIVLYILVLNGIIAFICLAEGILQLPENGKGQAIIGMLEEFYPLPETGLWVVIITGLLSK
jgi:hypothetical protein